MREGGFDDLFLPSLVPSPEKFFRQRLHELFVKRPGKSKVVVPDRSQSQRRLPAFVVGSSGPRGPKIVAGHHYSSLKSLLRSLTGLGAVFVASSHIHAKAISDNRVSASDGILRHPSGHR